MAILTVKKVWRRERTKPRLYTQLGALTPAQQANVLAFAKKLRARSSSWEALARRVGVHRVALFRACTGIQAPCAGLALRLKLAKGTLLSVRFSGDERVTLERAAKDAGLTLSEWSRRALLTAASSSR